MGNIYIFSEPIDSGKTATLESWLPKIKGAAGFLTPDIYGRRKLYDISTGDYLDLEIDSDMHPDHTKVGEQLFDNAVFVHGQQLLLNAMNNWPRWLIIDEINRLDIEGKGWEPALSEVINIYNDTDCECDMMLVVNNELLNEAIQHYRLHTAIVLDKKFFLR